MGINKMKTLFFLIASIAFANAAEFEIINNLGGVIWVGTQGNDGKPAPLNGGFVLEQGQSTTVNTDDDWAGRFWARTWCNPDDNHCQTGDCDNGLECNGAGGSPPVTLAEITLKGDQGQDFYDISLVDGFNTKAKMEPIDGQGDCRVLGCEADINAICPEELRVYGGNNNDVVVACNSACNEFRTDEFCCTGAYNDPNVCKSENWSTNYAKVFKDACPDAYSYAYDDNTSLFTCTASRYRITFSQ